MPPVHTSKPINIIPIAISFDFMVLLLFVLGFDGSDDAGLVLVDIFFNLTAVDDRSIMSVGPLNGYCFFRLNWLNRLNRPSRQAGTTGEPTP